MNVRAHALPRPARRAPEGSAAPWTLVLDGDGRHFGSAECAFCPVRAAGASTSVVDLARVEPTSSVAAWLDRRRVRSGLPKAVALPKAADPLRPSTPGLRAAALETLQLLLRRGVGVTLRTRGGLEDGGALLTLARRFPGLLAVEIALFSSDAVLIDDWERGTATVHDRLALGCALRDVGVSVGVVLAPLVPFVNDDPKAIRALGHAVARAGFGAMALEWIDDAPGLLRQVEQEVSPSRARILGGWFRQPGASLGGGRRQIAEPVRRRVGARLEAALAPTGVALEIREPGARVQPGLRPPTPAVEQLALFA